MCAGEAKEIGRSVIAPALASLLFTNVVGQSQQAAEVFDTSKQIFFEFAAESEKDLFHQFPILRMLQREQVICGDPPDSKSVEDRDESEHNPFHALSQRAEIEKSPVSDELVREALREIFRVEPRPQKKGGRPPWPFVHTPQSLLVMGTLAWHTLQQLSSRSEDICSIPILLSGDTGTGKSYLLRKYVELLYSSGVLDGSMIHTYILSARFDRDQVQKLGAHFLKSMKKIEGAQYQWSACILDEVFSSACMHLHVNLCYAPFFRLSVLIPDATRRR